MRMYRPVPVTLRVWVPPVPVVVEKIEVQFVPSGDVWIWNAVAYAASHCSTTWVIEALAPRSTCSHCGSLNALDQRVPVFPSTAFDAGNEAFSSDDAVAGWPCDSRTDAAPARLAGPTASIKAASAATIATMKIRRQANDGSATVLVPMATPASMKRNGCQGFIQALNLPRT